jgi:transcriptional regulator with XRE-family HTH domain
MLQEMTLRQARHAAGKTQTAIAERLNIGQDSVSRLEKRGDMLVSTLRDYVMAIGGKVRLVVEFEGHPPVELSSLGVKRKSTPKGSRPSARRPTKVA